MLADVKQLREDALKLEGIYLFEESAEGLDPEEVYAETAGRRSSDAA
jgi:hypothetical protein